MDTTPSQPHWTWLDMPADDGIDWPRRVAHSNTIVRAEVHTHLFNPKLEPEQIKSEVKRQELKAVRRNVLGPKKSRWS